jgi:hypothetical protein
MSMWLCVCVHVSVCTFTPPSHISITRVLSAMKTRYLRVRVFVQWEWGGEARRGRGRTVRIYVCVRVCEVV